MTVNTPQITDTYSAGIALSDGTGTDEDGNPVKTSAVNEIYIRDPIVTFLVPEAHPPSEVPDTDGIEIPVADGILITSQTEILRNVVITGCYVRGHTGHGVKIQPLGPGGVRWPVILQGWVKDEGRGYYRELAGDRDIHREGLHPV